MIGETNLSRLLASMTPCLLPGTFVFSTVPPGTVLPPWLHPVMLFREVEGMTLIAEKSEAIKAEFPFVFLHAWLHCKFILHWKRLDFSPL